MDNLQVPEMSEELQTPPNLEPAILLKLRLLCKHRLPVNAYAIADQSTSK